MSKSKSIDVATLYRRYKAENQRLRARIERLKDLKDDLKDIADCCGYTCSHYDEAVIEMSAKARGLVEIIEKECRA